MDLLIHRICAVLISSKTSTSKVRRFAFVPPRLKNRPGRSPNGWKITGFRFQIYNAARLGTCFTLAAELLSRLSQIYQSSRVSMVLLLCATDQRRHRCAKVSFSAPRKEFSEINFKLIHSTITKLIVVTWFAKLSQFSLISVLFFKVKFILTIVFWNQKHSNHISFNFLMMVFQFATEIMVSFDV